MEAIEAVAAVRAGDREDGAISVLISLFFGRTACDGSVLILFTPQGRDKADYLSSQYYSQ